MKNSNGLLIIIGVLAGLFFIAGGVLLYMGTAGAGGSEETAVTSATATPEELTMEEQIAKAVSETATAEAALNPQTVPTNTPINTTGSESSNSSESSGPPPSPTALATTEPTATPEATATPVPTDTPEPTNTSIPQPTAIPPTATPIPPTNTPAPTGPVAGQGARGLVADFALREGKVATNPGGDIWYDWIVRNTTGGEVGYSSIGVMPRKGGNDYPQWYQSNYGSDGSTIKPEGLEWGSKIAIPDTGDFTFRLVVCFDSFDACKAGNGTYHTLSSEIPLKIQ